MKANPFRFGSPVRAAELIDRQAERAELVRCLVEGRNLVLVAPHGMGKSSLLAAAAGDCREQGVHTIHVDLFPAINTRRFAEIYASALTLEPEGTIQEMQEAVQQLVPNFMPRVVVTGSGKPGLQLDLWDRDRDIRMLLDRILDAPSQIAAERKQPIAVVLDDFEDLLGLAEDELLDNLAAAVRKHRNVTYCFVLRKDSSASAHFAGEKGRFHGLAEGVALEPLPADQLSEGLAGKFSGAGMQVDDGICDRIVELADLSPHHAQRLAHAFFEVAREEGQAGEAQLRAGLGRVLDSGAYSYRSQWNQLAPHQRNLVLAIAQGYTERLHSQRMVFQLGLGSPSTVSKNLRTLSDREILQRRGDAVHFVDPWFGLWLKRRMT